MSINYRETPEYLDMVDKQQQQREKYKLLIDLLERSKIVTNESSQGYTPGCGVNSESTVKSVCEGFDWNRGTLLIYPAEDLFRGEAAKKDREKAKLFTNILEYVIAEKRDKIVNKGFAGYVRRLCKEYLERR